MKILITGSSGYIGSNLVEYLEKNVQDVEIIGLDSFPLLHLFHHPFIHSTILDAKLPLDVTHVVHLALSLIHI